MLSWVFYVSLVVALAQNVPALPQNGDTDGIFFDGPTNRPSRPLPTTRQGGTGGLRTTVPPTSSATTTTTAIPLAQFDSCVASCPVTPEYNPVCGTDNVLYNNPGGLNCASFCGKAVTIRNYGQCVFGATRG